MSYFFTYSVESGEFYIRPKFSLFWPVPLYLLSLTLRLFQKHSYTLNSITLFFYINSMVLYFKISMEESSPKCECDWFMVSNTTFNNISVIWWRSVLLMEETGVPGENHRRTLSHNVVSSTPRHERGKNSQR